MNTLINNNNDHPLLEPITTFRDSAEHLMPTSWLIADLVTTGELASIIGAPGCGKSFIALDMALSIASGIPYHGHTVTQGPVLYLAGEGVQGLEKRAAAWCLAHGQSTNSNLLIHQGAMDLANPEYLEAYATALEAELTAAPSLIIIDTLARYALSADENSNSDISRFIAQLQHHFQRRFNATVIVVHHTGKHGTSARGASALNGAVDHEFYVKELPADPLTKGFATSLESKKAKETEKHKPLVFDLEPQEVTLATGDIETSLVPHLRTTTITSPSDLNLSAAVKTLYDTLAHSPEPMGVGEVRASYQSRSLNTSNLKKQGQTLLTELIRVMPDAEVNPGEDLWRVLSRLVELQAASAASTSTPTNNNIDEI